MKIFPEIDYNRDKNERDLKHVECDLIKTEMSISSSQYNYVLKVNSFILSHFSKNKTKQNKNQI